MVTIRNLNDEERAFIERAVRYLEHPSFLIKLVDLLGSPLESLIRTVPPWVSHAVDGALQSAMKLTVSTLPRSAPPSDRPGTIGRLESKAFWRGYWHTASSALSGGTAGLFGGPALALELPLTTCLILRSMASVARQFGEDPRDPAVGLECLSLFSLGGPSHDDDDMDSSYLTTRLALASTVSKAVKFLVNTSHQEVALGIANGTAPSLIRLIAKIAGRYETVAMQKLLAQSLPVAGAVGAATINVVFADHFNTVACYHFGIRNLERRFGRSAVSDAYREAQDRYSRIAARRGRRPLRLASSPASTQLPPS